MSLNDKIQSIQSSRNQVSELQAQIREEVQQVQSFIKAGETTGDKIIDFVFVRYDSVNQEIVGAYRDLEARIQKRVGEFVLVVIREEEKVSFRCGDFGDVAIRQTIMPPPPDLFILKTSLILGVLKGKSLIFNIADIVDGKCEIPTSNIVSCLDARRDKFDVGNDNIIFPFLFPWKFYDLGLDLNKPLERKDASSNYKSHDEPILKLEVIVGDEEVVSWFKKQKERHYFVAFLNMARLLGRPTDKFPELEKELEQEQEQELRRRREEVAERLKELIRKRDELREEIERIKKAKKTGVYSSTGGASFAVCETDDDVNIISLKPRQKLKEVEDEIKEQLQTALELGMGDENLLSIKQLCREYGVQS